MAETMTQEFIGFDENPQQTLAAVYQNISREQMSGLPFFHPAMPVQVTLRLHEGQWLGCALTPWMLSVVILPGPQQVWPQREVGERLALRLPRGDMTFIVGELPQVGQLLSCSLMSPLEPALSTEQGEALAEDCLTMLFSLPVEDAGAPAPLSRRDLFSRLRAG